MRKLLLVKDIIFVILCIIAFKTKNQIIYAIIWANIFAEIISRIINNIKGTNTEN